MARMKEEKKSETEKRRKGDGENREGGKEEKRERGEVETPKRTRPQKSRLTPLRADVGSHLNAARPGLLQSGLS